MQNRYRIIKDGPKDTYANYSNSAVWNAFYKHVNRRWDRTSIVSGLDIIDEGLPAISVGLPKPEAEGLNAALSNLVHHFLKYKLGGDKWELQHINDDFEYRWEDAHCLDVDSYCCSAVLSADTEEFTEGDKVVKKLIGKFEVELFLKCCDEDYEVWLEIKFDYGVFRKCGALNVFTVEVTEFNGYLDCENIPHKFGKTAKDFQYIFIELGKLITQFERKYNGKLSLEDVIIVPNTNITSTCLCPYTGEPFRLLGGTNNSVCIDSIVPKARLVLLCAE